MSRDSIGPGSLKCVTAFSPERALRDTIRAALEDHVHSQDVRRLHDNAFVIYTEAEPADIRDWLRPLLIPEDSIFVVEFERWSGLGRGIDRAWLLRRGH